MLMLMLLLLLLLPLGLLLRLVLRLRLSLHTVALLLHPSVQTVCDILCSTLRAEHLWRSTCHRRRPSIHCTPKSTKRT